MKRAVIFDFGGVLMKTLDYRPRHAWDERLKLPHGSVERVVHGSDSWRQAQTGQLPVETYWQDVASQLKLSPDEVNQLKLDYFSGDVLDTLLMDYILELRKLNHPVGLLSNDSLELLPKLQRLGIMALFDALVVSAQIGFMKPAPQAYQAVL
ncbi:MAG TPA: HAD family hydrolase, partial [Phototrophicaceae bacterium]|nr:HAD family hydrolase [Phototrophicaceae bacterium]